MPEIDASPFIEQNTCASLEYQPMGCMLAPHHEGQTEMVSGRNLNIAS
jgi:hypothetical protein